MKKGSRDASINIDRALNEFDHERMPMKVKDYLDVTI